MTKNELPHILDCEKGIKVDAYSSFAAIWFWRNGDISSHSISPTKSSFSRVLDLFLNYDDQVQQEVNGNHLSAKLIYK